MSRILLCLSALSLSGLIFAYAPPDPSMPTYHLAAPLTQVKYPSGTSHPGTHPSFHKQQVVQPNPVIKAPPPHGD